MCHLESASINELQNNCAIELSIMIVIYLRKLQKIMKTQSSILEVSKHPTQSSLGILTAQALQIFY